MADTRSTRLDAALALTGSGTLLVATGTVGLLGRVAFRQFLGHSALALCCGIGAIAWGFLLQGRRRREQFRPIHRTRPVPTAGFGAPAPIPVPVGPHRVRVDAWIGPPRALPRG